MDKGRRREGGGDVGSSGDAARRSELPTPCAALPSGRLEDK